MVFFVVIYPGWSSGFKWWGTEIFKQVSRSVYLIANLIGFDEIKNPFTSLATHLDRLGNHSTDSFKIIGLRLARLPLQDPCSRRTLRQLKGLFSFKSRDMSIYIQLHLQKPTWIFSIKTYLFTFSSGVVSTQPSQKTITENLPAKSLTLAFLSNFQSSIGRNSDNKAKERGRR